MYNSLYLHLPWWDDKCPKMHQNWSQNVWNSKKFSGGACPQTPLQGAHFARIAWPDHSNLACSGPVWQRWYCTRLSEQWATLDLYRCSVNGMSLWDLWRENCRGPCQHKPNANPMRKERALARCLHSLGPESAQRAVLWAGLTWTQLGNSTADLASEACEATCSHYST